jgi:hypothetical protein
MNLYFQMCSKRVKTNRTIILSEQAIVGGLFTACVCCFSFDNVKVDGIGIRLQTT